MLTLIGETAMGAMDGLRVIDLTRVLGGPYCTMILADHGADVLKIEPPQGDETRGWGPPFLERTDGSRDASYFLGVNRNKRGMTLDLSAEPGRDTLRSLLADADVLMENFKPGTMERWGLGYPALEALFPRLVHCRVSGFGADGPLGGLPGYDAVIQAMTGLMSVNGEHGGVRMGTPIVDLATGLYSAIGVLMALQERQRSGRGQFVDMTLYDCGMALLHPQAANYFLNGARPAATGNAHPNISPYQTFETRTGPLFLAIGNDGQFRRLCAELGAPELAVDTRFTTNADRVANRAALTALLSALFAETESVTVCDRLLRAGLPAGPVLAIDQALEAPHTAARAMVQDAGGVSTLGTPIKLSRTPAGASTAPPFQSISTT